MSNRPTAVTLPALDARRSVTAQLREAVRELPPTPLEWSSFDVALAIACGEATSDLRLVNLAKLVTSAPTRVTELRALWAESLMTAAFAGELAPALGGSTNDAAIAGLLHRLGDLLTLRALTGIEQAGHVRVDAATRADMCREHAPEVLERTLRAWAVPARAAATAAGWRRLCEFPGTAADATSVHVGRLLAIEALNPQFCAPGVVELTATEAGIGAAGLSRLRASATMTRLLNTLQ